MKNSFPSSPFLYVITDERFLNLFNIYDAVERAVLAGAKVVQYRAKRKTAKEMLKEASLAKEAAKRHEALFIVNDRLDIALAVGADGVHLGQDDLPVEYAKEIAGKDFIVGLSTHNLKQVKEANSKKEFIDYIGFGPVFPTTTKENPDPITGVGALCEAVKVSDLPVVAIGGIFKDNLKSVLPCKPAAVAVVRAAFGSGDVYNEVAGLVSCLRETGS